MLLPLLASCPGEKEEAPGLPPGAAPPGPFANAPDADTTNSPSTTADDKILFIGSLSLFALIGSVPADPIALRSNRIGA